MGHPDLLAAPVKICVHPNTKDIVWGVLVPNNWRAVYSVETNDEAWRLIQFAMQELIVTKHKGRYIATERTPGTLILNVFGDELRAVHKRNELAVNVNRDVKKNERTKDYVGYETADLVPFEVVT